MIGNKNKIKKFDANSIPYSQAVTHPGTNGTRRCLDFGELTRPGAFSVVWPLTPTHCSTQTKVQLQLYYSYLSLIYIYSAAAPTRAFYPYYYRVVYIYSLSPTKSTVARLLLVLLSVIYTAAAPTRAPLPYYLMTVLRPLTPLDHRRRSCPAQLPPTQYRAVPACTQGGGRFNGSLAVKTPPKSSRQPRTRHSDLFFLFPTTLESLSLSIDSFIEFVASNEYSTLLFFSAPARV